ncbi:FKBP-type peptidyl-prolyl cis-trans isomerase [Hymenobacter terricola]|uniref:FKBP-type peptidyl-prolyl cis-trans isomerase n=1 Tax=Hymenobacter terricola TaxID=2819236 RepID=UPI001B317303|nr:FKBP-type peptidyl-prolyl cis-trans isomerase [Hymenobacter terricola]
MLLTTAGLMTTACKKDDSTTTTTTDYAPIDNAIIQKYLTDNAITTAQKQASGLYYLPVVSNPTGTRAVAGKLVYVLYTGRLMDGTVFDASSMHNNVPISFVLGQGRVIAGWDEGIALMHEGEKAQLLIPSALAYGASGSGTTIPANSVLRFEVELVAVR